MNLLLEYKTKLEKWGPMRVQEAPTVRQLMAESGFTVSQYITTDQLDTVQQRAQDYDIQLVTIQD